MRVQAFLLAVLALSLTASAGVFGKAVRVSDVDTWAMAVDREGDRLYAAAGDSLVVLDISNPLLPRKLGEVAGMDNRRQVVARDRMAYLVSRETGLRIIDCTDPTAPRIRSRYDSVEFATGVEVVGNVAFLSERINGVEFVDVSDPDRPAHIAIRKTGESQSSRYRDGYLYSGEWGMGEVTVFDARDMRSIREVGRLKLHGFGDGLEIAGNHLYCSTGHDAKNRREWKGKEAEGRGRGLDIFALDDPAHPKHVGRVDFPRFLPRNEDFWTVRVAGGMAYCADSHNGLFAVDVRDPANPKVVDRFCVPQPDKPEWPSGAISSIAVGEGCLYVTSYPGGLFVLPIEGLKPEARPKGAVPLHPEFRETYPTDAKEFFVYKPERPGQARTVVVRGDLVYAAFGDAGLHVLRIRPEGGFDFVGELPNRKVYDCCFCGDRLVTAEGLDGFAVYALDGPVGFRELQRRPQSAPRQSVAFWCWAPDDKTVVLTGRCGPRAFFPIADINARRQLDIHGTCQWDKYLADRAIGGVLPELVPYRGIQWMTRGATGWEMLSRTAPMRPDDSRAAGQTCGVCAFGDRFLVTLRNSYAADGSQPLPPSAAIFGSDRKLGPAVALAGGIEGVPRSDGRLVALNNRSQKVVSLYDFADASAPKLLKKWQLAGNPDLCAFHKGQALIPAGHQGLLMSKCRPRLAVGARGGVFTEGQVPSVTLEGAFGDVGWTLLDWRRQTVRTGVFPPDGRQFFPALPRGYYFVQAKGAGTNVHEATFCLVADPATRSYPRDSFYGVDAALSWVCSPGHYVTNWYGDNSYAACLDLIRLAGLVHVRERLSWREVSKTPGAYDWGRYLANARLARERGLVVGGMFHDAAPYADVLKKGPRDLAAVYRFCRDAAQAFGDAVGGWEFWNEPDISFYPEPVWDFMSAQKAAYLGFKAANRRRPVLNGAVCTGAYADYEDALFENDLTKYSDVFNFHTYHEIAAYPALLKRLHDCLGRAGVSDRAVWLTEYGTNLEGHSAGDGLLRGVKAHSYEQEMVLAEVYAKATTGMQMLGVSRGYWFVFGAYNERNGTKDWGVQRRDGSVKPIYQAMATTTEYLTDAKIEGELKVAEGVRAFVFRHPDGRQCLVSWAVTPCDTVKGWRESPVKSVGKSFDRPFSIAVRDGTYAAADWCGVKSSVRAQNGRLALKASRYASFVDGLSGLKPDVPAIPAGGSRSRATAPDEDLSVVLRVDFATNDFQVVSGKTAVDTEGDRGRVKLVFWNLSDEPKTGVAQVDGVVLEGLPPKISLPPMESVAVDATLVYTNASSPAVQAVFSGTFNGRRTSRLAVRVRSEKRFYDLCTMTPIGTEGVSYWTRNDSASRTRITWDEKEKAVRFDCVWDDPRTDRWFYPFHTFTNREESFDGAVELAFDVKMESNKMENDVSTSLVMFIGSKAGGGSASYLAPNGNWEKRKVSLADLRGQPRHGGLTGFRVGCNPKGTRMTYWIRNLRLFRAR